MKILALIPARGQSKSIVRKNIIMVGNKPLLAWTIEASNKSKYISKTVVSSEDQEILEIARKFGAELILRPQEYARDDSPIIDVINDTISQFKKRLEEFNVLVLLQPTSPLRDSTDIDRAIDLFLKRKATGLISGYLPGKSPYKAFKITENGWLEGLVDNNSPFMNRQQLPTTFYPNGAIYIVSVPELVKNQSLLTSKTIPFIMDQDKNIDIDSPSDIDSVSKKILTRDAI